MKKIININLSGRVIPIEDSAYEKLQAYIESLRRYFANEEGRDEIINDIESRIAELMSEKIRKGSDSITDADVNEVIASMGTVEDFEAAENETAPATASTSSQQNNQQNYSYTEKKPRGRLYRDTNDKFIGGVCSGIANYLNVDPAVVRLLFAIIGFGTGIGFLAYIILWIVLPPKDLDGYTGKRLYRNPEDKILGGVAGGLAAYFNKKASNIRLIFVAPLLLNILINILNGFRWHYDFDLVMNIGFGSLTGTFILTYIILWIVLPEARSDYQKMEMRGETVDVNRIRQNVKEGMENMKGRMKEWGQEVKESAQNIGNKAKEFAGTKGKAFADDVKETARRSGNGLGHAIGVIFKVFFLFIAGSIAFGLFIAFIALIFGGVAWWPVNNFLWTSKWQQVYAWGTLIFFIGIPLIAFIVWLVRRILRTRSRNNYIGWTFAALWTIGWISAVLFASSISRDFSNYVHADIPITVNQPANGKMIVAVSQPGLEYSGSMSWMDDENRGWDLSSDTLRLSTVRFNIKASTDAAYHVTLKKYSYGRSEEDAMTRAENIQYSVLSRDSVLDLSSGYEVSKENKFRLQQVEIEIQVPVGKKIRFDESVKEKLNPANFKIRKTYRRNRVVNIEMNNDEYFSFRSGVDYTMSEGGELTDPAGNSASQQDNNYRYQNPDTSKTIKPDKKDSLEERKKRLNEELKKIDDIQKQGKPDASIKEIKEDGGKNTFSANPSPVFSMIQIY
jgi:phage shock protein PspC (stress-responsive transcriptional regulator)